MVLIVFILPYVEKDYIVGNSFLFKAKGTFEHGKAGSIPTDEPGFLPPPAEAAPSQQPPSSQGGEPAEVAPPIQSPVIQSPSSSSDMMPSPPASVQPNTDMFDFVDEDQREVSNA